VSELRVADLAANNAAWCAAVCAAHGGRSERAESHWLSRTPMPPLYPNLVTLTPAAAPTLGAVRALRASLPASSWAVKDSYRRLALEPLGFRRLFDAEWLLRPASLAPPQAPSSGARWRSIRTEPALAAWEARWGESAGGARVFLPALLEAPEIAILAAFDGDELLSGVIANRHERTVGVTNFFAHGASGETLRGEGIRAAMDVFPGLAVVGYASGLELAALRALGFERAGPLRIWAHGT
jgi:hypothetical protein